MNRKRMREAASILTFPGLEELEKPKKLWWIIRILILLGVAMPNTENPRGWSWNPAVITLTITIAGLIFGGGYYIGSTDAEKRHLLERIAVAEKNAADAKQLGTYAVSGRDSETGHKPEQKKEK